MASHCPPSPQRLRQPRAARQGALSLEAEPRRPPAGHVPALNLTRCRSAPPPPIGRLALKSRLPALRANGRERQRGGRLRCAALRGALTGPSGRAAALRRFQGCGGRGGPLVRLCPGCARPVRRFGTKPAPRPARPRHGWRRRGRGRWRPPAAPPAPALRSGPEPGSCGPAAGSSGPEGLPAAGRGPWCCCSARWRRATASTSWPCSTAAR